MEDTGCVGCETGSKVYCGPKGTGKKVQCDGEKFKKESEICMIILCWSLHKCTKLHNIALFVFVLSRNALAQFCIWTSRFVANPRSFVFLFLWRFHSLIQTYLVHSPIEVSSISFSSSMPHVADSLVVFHEPTFSPNLAYRPTIVICEECRCYIRCVWAQSNVNYTVKSFREYKAHWTTTNNAHNSTENLAQPSEARQKYKMKRFQLTKQSSA